MGINTKFKFVETDEGGYYLGTDQADLFKGTATAEVVHAGKGHDQLHGGGGDDLLYGGQGNDQFWGDAGNDYLVGFSGADKIKGGSGRDFLEGNAGDDELWGGAGNDVLYGDLGLSSGNDKIWGEAGADTVVADGGDDIVSLGTGNDTLDVRVHEFGEGSDQEIGRTTVTDFDPAQDHLEIYIAGIDDDGYSNALFASDFFDSNDDGVIDRRDAEVSYSNGALVLDVDAVLKRAFGPAQTGDEAIKLQGVTSIDAYVVRPNPDFDTSGWLHEAV